MNKTFGFVASLAVSNSQISASGDTAGSSSAGGVRGLKNGSKTPSDRA